MKSLDDYTRERIAELDELLKLEGDPNQASWQAERENLIAQLAAGERFRRIRATGDLSDAVRDRALEDGSRWYR